MRRILLLTAAFLLVAPATALAGAVFLVEGGGWGHGVGMAQWGAEGAAIHGWSYRRILGHYYPGTAIQIVPARPVRVLLAEGRSSVEIGSAAPYLVVAANGRKVHVAAGRTLRLGPDLRLGKNPLIPPVRIVPGAQPLTLGSDGYRGELRLLRRDGGLPVVNRIRLDLYLRGVVPYEMPKGWHAEAYKAQAVVARSYALATMHSATDFDLYADTRNQVYGGIKAETPATNQALGATASRVLTYGGRIIVAYYHSSSGGRTDSSRDVWHGPSIPYLVSVPDPFDTISPHHRWSLVLRPQALASRYGLPVRDLRLERDSGGRAARVLLLGGGRTKAIDGTAFRRDLALQSTFFTVRVLSLDPPPVRAIFGRPLTLTGFLRGIGGVVLQQRSESGTWSRAASVRAHSDGRFQAVVRPRFTTAYRLAVDGVPGEPVTVEVERRIDVSADGGLLAGTVLPAAAVQLERLVGDDWRPVRQIPVGPSGFFRAEVVHDGRYRAAAPGGGRYLASASRPVSVVR